MISISLNASALASWCLGVKYVSCCVLAAMGSKLRLTCGGGVS